MVRTRPAGAQSSAPAFDAERKLRELSFLHEFAKLLTTARNWDELMRTIVDRTTDALDVEVCSVYLMERDSDKMRLAATNGLDRDQVGSVRWPSARGSPAVPRLIGRPVASPDVRVDPRFKWVPGFDQSQFVSMLSVPMPWNDSIIGVINVQAIEIAHLLAGGSRVPRHDRRAARRHRREGPAQAEAEEQLQTLTALDGARAELAGRSHPRVAHATGRGPRVRGSARRRGRGWRRGRRRRIGRPEPGARRRVASPGDSAGDAA